MPQQSKQTGALIDAPVGPYSDPNDIRAWIDELRAMPSNIEEVRRALADAEWMLARRLECGER